MYFDGEKFSSEDFKNHRLKEVMRSYNIPIDSFDKELNIDLKSMISKTKRPIMGNVQGKIIHRIIKDHANINVAYLYGKSEDMIKMTENPGRPIFTNENGEVDVENPVYIDAKYFNFYSLFSLFYNDNRLCVGDKAIIKQCFSNDDSPYIKYESEDVKMYRIDSINILFNLLSNIYTDDELRLERFLTPEGVQFAKRNAMSDLNPELKFSKNKKVDMKGFVYVTVPRAFQSSEIFKESACDKLDLSLLFWNNVLCKIPVRLNREWYRKFNKYFSFYENGFGTIQSNHGVKFNPAVKHLFKVYKDYYENVIPVKDIEVPSKGQIQSLLNRFERNSGVEFMGNRRKRTLIPEYYNELISVYDEFMKTTSKTKEEILEEKEKEAAEKESNVVETVVEVRDDPKIADQKHVHIKYNIRAEKKSEKEEVENSKKSNLLDYENKKTSVEAPKLDKIEERIDASAFFPSFLNKGTVPPLEMPHRAPSYGFTNAEFEVSNYENLNGALKNFTDMIRSQVSFNNGKKLKIGFRFE